jgi:hypothetical protein
MLEIKEFKAFLQKLSKNITNEEMGSTAVVHPLKVISTLFSLLADIKEEYILHAIAHGFGALMTTFERVPDVRAVNRPDDKKRIMDLRGNLSSAVKLFIDKLDAVIAGEVDAYTEILSLLYKSVSNADTLSRHFVSMMPPME